MSEQAHENDQTPRRDGERALLEITVGSSPATRFSVCYWLNGEWNMEDSPDSVKERGYRVVAVHSLPPRTTPAMRRIEELEREVARLRRAGEIANKWAGLGIMDFLPEWARDSFLQEWTELENLLKGVS